MNIQKLVIFVIFCIPWSYSATLGDRILQEREARLNALDRMGVSKEKKQTSALSGVDNVDGEVQLVEQNKGLRSFTLMDAVKTALENNQLLSNRKLEHQNQLIQKNIVPGARKFFVDAYTGLNRAGNIGADPAGSTTRKIIDLGHQEDAYYLGLKMEMMLLDGGVSTAQKNTQQLGANIKQLELENTKQNLILEITSIFVKLLLLREELKIAADEVDIARFHLAETEKSPSKDNQLPMEVLQAKLELEKSLQYESSLLSQQRRLNDQFTSLLKLPANLQFAVEKNAKTKVLDDTVEGMIKKALNFHPEIQIARLQLKQKEARNMELMGQKQPSLNLFGKTEFTRLMDREKVDESRYLAGVEINWNLLDGNRNKNKRSQNRNEKSILKNNIARLETELQNSIHTNFQDYLSSKNMLQANLANIRMAKTVMYEAEDRFQKRQISRLKLLKARLQYKTSVYNYYKVLGNLIQSKLNLFALTGKLDLKVFG